jgi:hypothetical protein
MNKYNNGKIYTLRCYDDQTLIYVGSTTQPLYKRFFEHKRDASKFKERTLYTKMNELGSDKFYIELYELYSCNSKEELNKREGEVIEKITCICGCMTARSDIAKHMKTKKHNDLMNNINI